MKLHRITLKLFDIKPVKFKRQIMIGKFRSHKIAFGK